MLRNLFNRTACYLLSRSNHTQSKTIEQENMKVHIVPALSDNYMYLLEDVDTKETVAIDPVDADRIIMKLNELGLKLTKILTTHHHLDHSGGNSELVGKLKNQKLEVLGGDNRIGALTKLVKQDDQFKVGNLEVTCHFTPCHTSGHICYYVTKNGTEPCVFTGDTLFQAGCGRFFEGTAEQMYDALINKLGKLPGNTKVYCGHEYTVSNLKFALSVELQNQSIIDRLEWAQKQRSSNQPTIPSTLMEEKQFNPFMRVNESSIQSSIGTTGDPIATMNKLREMKNNFR